jgi:hypothetical protein
MAFEAFSSVNILMPILVQSKKCVARREGLGRENGSLPISLARPPHG